MRIHTIEEEFEYQMKKIITKFKKDFDLNDLNAEELQEKIWNDLSKEFGRYVLEGCNEYSGDDFFESN